MSAKSWNKLSTMLEELLSQNLNSKDAKSVMTAWGTKKGDVSKLMESTTRTKKKKDPNAPKKWKTGYIIFCSDQRDKLKAKNGNLSATELTTKLGEMWQKLSEKDKKKYEASSAQDKVRYEKEMESYTPPEPSEDDVKDAKASKRVKKERTGPKRPMSAYLYFCQQTRPELKKENPDLGGKDATTELANRWNALSDKQKEPFNKMHARDKERYEAEKVASGESTKATTPATPVKPKDAKASKAVPKAPAKPPSGKAVEKTPGFEAFAEERTEDLQSEHPEWNQKKLMTEIGKSWQSLSEGDREAYEQEARNMEDEEEEEVDEDD